MEELRPYSEAWIRARLSAKGKRVHQSLGQHYLVNAGAVSAIARACLDRALSRRAVEIGAGMGVLTQALLSEGCAVNAVEIEADSAEILSETLLPRFGDRLSIRLGNYLEMNALQLGVDPMREFLVCGNLPYNQVGEILLHTVELFREKLPPMVFMMQREVARKLAAPPSGDGYGVLSVLAQALFDAKAVLQVAPGSFFPPPKVQSTVLALSPVRRISEFGDWNAFHRLVRLAFGQRRKKLSKALRGGFLPESKLVGAWIRCPELPDRRAEELSWDDFRRLSQALR